MTHGVGPAQVERTDVDSLLRRARRLAQPGGRRLLGITGSPGTGKSTLAGQVVEVLGDVAALVGMDGFHLARDQLRQRGLLATKGAPDTFDVPGFVHLLRRLRSGDDDVVYAPAFRRDLEEPIAGAVAVRHDTPLVVVEGNYLLVEDGGWGQVRGLLDEVWFLRPDEGVRRTRLVERHMAFGRDREAAEERSGGSDQRNADLVDATRHRADVLVVGHQT